MPVGDGNFVVYTNAGVPVWHSGTAVGAGLGPFTLVMQTDQNLVIYTSGGAALWSIRRSIPVVPCPVNCAVGDWSAFAPCNQPCGQTLVVSRTRDITVQPSGGGAGCPGLVDSTTCPALCCPVNCAVSGWSGYGSCSVACGGGTQSRSRTIITNPSCGGIACPSGLSESISCNAQCCAVDCAQTPWSTWTACDRTCGGGTQTRSRTTTRAAACNGVACGALSESQSCNTSPCPIDCKLSAVAMFYYYYYYCVSSLCLTTAARFACVVDCVRRMFEILR